MKTSKIRLALAIATAAFISVPIAASAAGVGARSTDYRKSPGARTNKSLPAKAGQRKSKAGARAIKKRVSPRGIDTSPGKRQINKQSNKHAK